MAVVLIVIVVTVELMGIMVVTLVMLVVVVYVCGCGGDGDVAMAIQHSTTSFFGATRCIVTSLGPTRAPSANAMSFCEFTSAFQGQANKNHIGALVASGCVFLFLASLGSTCPNGDHTPTHPSWSAL